MKDVRPVSKHLEDYISRKTNLNTIKVTRQEEEQKQQMTKQCIEEDELDGIDEGESVSSMLNKTMTNPLRSFMKKNSLILHKSLSDVGGDSLSSRESSKVIEDDILVVRLSYFSTPALVVKKRTTEEFGATWNSQQLGLQVLPSQ